MARTVRPPAPRSVSLATSRRGCAAETVRLIFQRYLALVCVPKLQAGLDARGTPANSAFWPPVECSAAAPSDVGARSLRDQPLLLVMIEAQWSPWTPKLSAAKAIRFPQHDIKDCLFAGCGARIRTAGDQADRALSRGRPVQRERNSRQAVSRLVRGQQSSLRNSPPP